MDRRRRRQAERARPAVDDDFDDEENEADEEAPPRRVQAVEGPGGRPAPRRNYRMEGDVLVISDDEEDDAEDDMERLQRVRDDLALQLRRLEERGAQGAVVQRTRDALNRVEHRLANLWEAAQIPPGVAAAAAAADDGGQFWEDARGLQAAAEEDGDEDANLIEAHDFWEDRRDAFRRAGPLGFLPHAAAAAAGWFADLFQPPAPERPPVAATLASGGTRMAVPFGLLGTGENGEPEVGTCAVCWERFRPRESLDVCPNGHAFHTGCVDPLRRGPDRRADCPNCREAFQRRAR